MKSRNMNEKRARMIIGFFVLIRVLIFKVILRPWECQAGLNMTETLRRNAKTLGSVMFYVVVDYFRNTIPTCPNNQIHLPNDWKIKPRNTGPLRAEDQQVDDPEFYIRTGKKGEDEEIFDGLYTREQLAPMLATRKLWYIGL
jgi:hypothetical protein